MAKLLIVAAIADVNNIVLYCEDGSTHSLSSSDYRTTEIMNIVMPKINANKVAEIEIDDFNLHNEFSAKTGGLIKFYRVLKKKVLGIFDKEQPTMTVKEIEETGETKSTAPLALDETVVAIVGGKAIPQMEALDKQFTHVVKNNGSATGMVRFLERIGKVIDERGHSVEDLLKFIKDADLPIAEDGTMVAYKSLKKTQDEGTYVDIHSRNVRQRVGTRVFMAPHLVDHNRGRDCSNGLHIARRDYIRTFRGDVIVICKIAPEDIIAVPQYSPSKIRVCGYDIVAALDDEAKELLERNLAMTSNENAALLLGQIIKGIHTPILNTTEITSAYGGGLVYTDLTQKTLKPLDTVPEVPLITPLMDTPEEPVQEAVAEVVAPVQALEDIKLELAERDPSLSPKALREKADAILLQRKADEAEAKAMGMTYIQIQARNLFIRNKTKKEVMAELEVPRSTISGWIKKYNWTVRPDSPNPAAQTGVDKQVQDEIDNNDGVKKQPAKAGHPTVRDQAQALFATWQKSKNADDLNALLAFKKSKKKSWAALGFVFSDETMIKSAANKLSL